MTSVTCPGSISSSIFRARMKKPCVTSSVLRRNLTVSPRLMVIWFGANSNRLAVISMTRGLLTVGGLTGPAAVADVPISAAASKDTPSFRHEDCFIIVPLKRWGFQKLMNAVNSSKFAGGEFDIFNTQITRDRLAANALVHQS